MDQSLSVCQEKTFSLLLLRTEFWVRPSALDFRLSTQEERSLCEEVAVVVVLSSDASQVAEEVLRGEVGGVECPRQCEDGFLACLYVRLNTRKDIPQNSEFQ